MRSRSFPCVAFETVPILVWLTMALSGSFKEARLALPLSTSLSSRRSMVWMSLALYPQVESQAPQHFISSEKQATCKGCFCLPIYVCCFARQSMCLVIFLHSGMSRAVHPQELPKVDVDHWRILDWAFHSTFNFFVLSLSNLWGW